MDDAGIVELFWKRDEEAIRECRASYEPLLRSIAYRILGRSEDVKECLNDTWLRAWNAIPPERPRRLVAFLGTITRHLALDCYRRGHSKRQGQGETALCLDELGECIGEEHPIEDRLALREVLNAFLEQLPERSRRLFQLRYWYVMPVADIARQEKMSESAVKMQLSRARQQLAALLRQEGFL